MGLVLPIASPPPHFKFGLAGIAEGAPIGREAYLDNFRCKRHHIPLLEPLTPRNLIRLLGKRIVTLCEQAIFQIGFCCKLLSIAPLTKSLTRRAHETASSDFRWSPSEEIGKLVPGEWTLSEHYWHFLWAVLALRVFFDAFLHCFFPLAPFSGVCVCAR